ncbi:hypothetical protein BC834DRAFT_109916 [Gloeopeniophorella convolvens]|nr:hypothetical protein BC834DRAFT_109916 [Gloeopeniophorella convolvens]
MAMPPPSTKKAKRKGPPASMDVDGAPPKKPRKGKEKADGEFRAIKASVVLAVPPVFAGRLRDGVEEMLDAMIMRYEPALDGVVLAHADIHFLDSVARLQGDSPFAVCKVGFEALVWSPLRGMQLAGRVTLCSPDHVSLLVHRTFNVSIPRHHIPTDEWAFEYGPAENDPEFGGAEEDAEAQGDDVLPDQRGRWVHKVTGDHLGGKDRRLQFTVVGCAARLCLRTLVRITHVSLRLTVANQMLSLVGSIQPDPLSPDHVPQSKPTRAHSPQPQPPPLLAADAIEPAASDEEEEPDAFAELGRMGDEAARKAREEKEAQAKAAKKREKEERKRKRKEDKDRAAKAEGKAGAKQHKRKKTS